ncbi:MAG: signal peptidase [Pedosphaera sp.]|nr:signal peptidase [Pedosphaera sp.]
MIQNLTDGKPSMNLRMVPIPEVAPQATRCVPSRVKRSRFNLIRLVQHFGTLVLVLALSGVCYFTISRFFLETVEVVGVSMVPTLQEHAHYVLNRWAFHKKEPQHSDVVVIKDPADHGFSVKRVIATAGDAVLLKDGKVFVNGKELAEPYLNPNTHTYTYSQAKEQLITCGKDHYFVLGDNRPQSIDSRSYGPVPRENVLGLVLVR